MKKKVLNEISDSQIEHLVRLSLKDVKDEDISPEKIERYKNDYGGMPYMIGIKAIVTEINPKKRGEKGEEIVTGIFVVSADQSQKNNYVDMFVLSQNEVVTIRDSGMTISNNLEMGCIYKFNCTTYTYPKSEELSYRLKSGEMPEKLNTLTEPEFMKALHRAKKSIRDISNYEPCVLLCEMTMGIYPVNDKNKNPRPMYIQDDEIGEGFLFRATLLEPKEDGDGLTIKANFRPQRYGKQIFEGIFPEDFYEEYIEPSLGNLMSVLLNWLIPQPTSLKMFAIGKASIQQEGQYKGDRSLWPCAGLIMDSSMYDGCLDGYHESEAGEPEAQPKETSPSDDKQKVDDKRLKQYFKFNADSTLKEINELLDSQNFKHIRKARYDRIKKEIKG